MQLIVIMGPSGCGKSTIGQAFARRSGFAFLEGDDFHPAENVARMANGTALSDADRVVWVDAMLAGITGNPAPTLVLACSALTPYVQDRLVAESGRVVRFVLLEVAGEQLRDRLSARRDHFMPPALLDSQIAALRAPPGVIRIDGSVSQDAVVAAITAALEDKR